MTTRIMTRSAAAVAARHPEAAIHFRSALVCVFKMWTALELALFHQWGGAEGSVAAAELVEEIMAMFVAPEKVYKDDVALVLEDFLDTRFHTVCEDGSPEEIGDLLCNLWKSCCEGDFSRAERIQAQERSRPSAVVHSQGMEGGDELDSDDDELNEEEHIQNQLRLQEGLESLQEQEENDEDMGGSMRVEQDSSADAAAPPLPPLVDEEGFETVVVGKKKKEYASRGR